MNIRQQIKTVEEEYTICKRKLNDYHAEYLATTKNHPKPFTKSMNVDDLLFQVSIYYRHLNKLRDELIGLYLVGR